MGEPAVARTRAEASVATIAGCRLCGSPLLTALWSFGETPLANAYLTREELGQPELFVPLNVFRCETCALVQLRETVSPDVLFQNYLYVSSTSPAFVKHFDAYAAHLVERFRLSPPALVIEIGSNDGILLKPLLKRGVRVLGIEPARAIAERATASGVPTVPDFFSAELAARLLAEHGPAEIVTANNVFAHLKNLEDIVAGVRRLLTPDGVFAFEVQYLGDLLAKNLFDIVYHEHLCYYHVSPLVSFFSNLDMEVFDVQRFPVHGGSIRVFVQRARGPHPRDHRLEAILAEERARGLETPLPYARFSEQMEQNKRALQVLLGNLRNEGKRIVGYGAPAKATTFLYTFGIPRSTLDYIVDDDETFKQGRYTPGLHIPIVPPSRLHLDRPEYCLILAWNFAEQIMRNHVDFTNRGGRFIVPVPEPRVV